MGSGFSKEKVSILSIIYASNFFTIKKPDPSFPKRLDSPNFTPIPLL